MKYLLAVLLLSALSFAGVARFSVRHVVKPAAKVSAKAVSFSAKKSYQAVKASAKAAKKAAY